MILDNHQADNVSRRILAACLFSVFRLSLQSPAQRAANVLWEEWFKVSQNIAGTHIHTQTTQSSGPIHRFETSQECKTALTSQFKTLCLYFCIFVFLSRHHFDQMSEGSQSTLCVQNLKVAVAVWLTTTKYRAKNFSNCLDYSSSWCFKVIYDEKKTKSND